MLQEQYQVSNARADIEVSELDSDIKILDKAEFILNGLEAQEARYLNGGECSAQAAAEIDSFMTFTAKALGCTDLPASAATESFNRDVRKIIVDVIRSVLKLLARVIEIVVKLVAGKDGLVHSLAVMLKQLNMTDEHLALSRKREAATEDKVSGSMNVVNSIYSSHVDDQGKQYGSVTSSLAGVNKTLVQMIITSRNRIARTRKSIRAIDDLTKKLMTSEDAFMLDKDLSSLLSEFQKDNVSANAVVEGGYVNTDPKSALAVYGEGLLGGVRIHYSPKELKTRMAKVAPKKATTTTSAPSSKEAKAAISSFTRFSKIEKDVKVISDSASKIGKEASDALDALVKAVENTPSTQKSQVSHFASQARKAVVSASKLSMYEAKTINTQLKLTARYIAAVNLSAS